ncbi:hypothetical protein NE865_10891 [Phthorimaea operculella]|nr:hypothetical protein NE865_10891 [Phthorimaea operculella]
MSDDFIPLNQSTPTGNKWQNQGRINNRGIHGNYNQQNQSHNQSGFRRGSNFNRRGNHSQRNSSYGSDSANNSSYSQDGPPIDAYIHPAMLQDPWEPLRRKMQNSQ